MPVISIFLIVFCIVAVLAPGADLWFRVAGIVNVVILIDVIRHRRQSTWPSWQVSGIGEFLSNIGVDAKCRLTESQREEQCRWVTVYMNLAGYVPHDLAYKLAANLEDARSGKGLPPEPQEPSDDASDKELEKYCEESRRYDDEIVMPRINAALDVIRGEIRSGNLCPSRSLEIANAVYILGYITALVIGVYGVDLWLTKLLKHN